jgi:Kef-type K+ transport system membrane component KefB
MGKRFALPLAVSEIILGVIFGQSFLNKIPIHNSALNLLASIGFALTMMLTGSHINLAKFKDKKIFDSGIIYLISAVIIGLLLAILFHKFSGFLPIWVLFLFIFSSSAAIIFPSLSAKILEAKSNSVFILFITATDLLSLILIPFALDRNEFAKRVLGIFLTLLAACLIFFLLRLLIKNGKLEKFGEYSRAKKFGWELRISMTILLSLATLASKFYVSTMVAGLAVGLALAPGAISHRLARQLFGIAEGFFSPIFYIFLGAQLDFRGAFANHDVLLSTGFLLIGTLLLHGVIGVAARNFPIFLNGVATLGVPISIISIGQSTKLLTPYQCDAIALASFASIILFVINSQVAKVTN